MDRRTAPSPSPVMAASIIAAQQSRQLALNSHLSRIIDLRFIGAVGGIEPDALSFAAEIFERRFRIVDQGDDDLAFAGDISALDQREIAVQNL